MKRLQQTLRNWIGVDEGHRRESRRTARAILELTRQIATLQGLVHHQTELTTEALHKAGWQTEDEVEQHTILQRTLRAVSGDDDVIAGPWTGEVGFELLYWIPFLNWLVQQGLDSRRLVVVSRGGTAPWYRHLTSRYIDVLDLMPPAEFRRRTSEAKRKQFSAKRELDRHLIEMIRRDHHLQRAIHVHPSAMFHLFAGLWRKRATMELVESFTVFRRLEPLPVADGDDARRGLPDGYIAAKFYFSDAFPDTAENRAFVSDLLRRVSRTAPVALMSSEIRLDDHVDFHMAASSGVHVVETHLAPQKNLERQTQIINGARGFLGTYGGFSYLAPFYGVRSLSFFSRRQGFHHLEHADRMFDRLLPGGFLAVDRRAADLITPAVERWTTPVVHQPGHRDIAVEPAEVDVVK